jgi:hypothetical protein
VKQDFFFAEMANLLRGYFTTWEKRLEIYVSPIVWMLVGESL